MGLRNRLVAKLTFLLALLCVQLPRLLQPLQHRTVLLIQLCLRVVQLIAQPLLLNALRFVSSPRLVLLLTTHGLELLHSSLPPALIFPGLLASFVTGGRDLLQEQRGPAELRLGCCRLCALLIENLLQSRGLRIGCAELRHQSVGMLLGLCLRVLLRCCRLLRVGCKRAPVLFLHVEHLRMQPVKLRVLFIQLHPKLHLMLTLTLIHLVS